jgi:hypothetical protein
MKQDIFVLTAAYYYTVKNPLTLFYSETLNKVVYTILLTKAWPLEGWREGGLADVAPDPAGVQPALLAPFLQRQAGDSRDNSG